MTRDTIEESIREQRKEQEEKMFLDRREDVLRKLEHFANVDFLSGQTKHELEMELEMAEQIENFKEKNAFLTELDAKIEAAVKEHMDRNSLEEKFANMTQEEYQKAKMLISDISYQEAAKDISHEMRDNRFMHAIFSADTKELIEEAKLIAENRGMDPALAEMVRKKELDDYTNELLSRPLKGYEKIMVGHYALRGSELAEQILEKQKDFAGEEIEDFTDFVEEIPEPKRILPEMKHSVDVSNEYIESVAEANEVVDDTLVTKAIFGDRASLDFLRVKHKGEEGLKMIQEALQKRQEELQQKYSGENLSSSDISTLEGYKNMGSEFAKNLLDEYNQRQIEMQAKLEQQRKENSFLGRLNRGVSSLFRRRGRR